MHLSTFSFLRNLGGRFPLPLGTGVSPGVPLLEPVQQGVLVEGGRRRHVAAGQLDVGDRVGGRDHLDQPRAVARC